MTTGTDRPGRRSGPDGGGAAPGNGSVAPEIREEPGIPPAISAVVPPGHDYGDVYTLVTPGASDTSPEEWARTALDEVAGRKGWFVWRVILGLRLRRGPSPDRIAGWRIAERRDGLVLLEARSWMITGHIVVHVRGDEVSLATVVHFERPAGARVWSALTPLHRRGAPELLRDAHTARLRRGR
ncbi:hypothetical protein ABZ714_24960 [Streptomyces sp. NPDC006798]|uniref:hypothetical protein n=1 Tax=Streptomyces sp. NPDC006798 TaxID=3155462 RepID=UPI0033C5B7A6